MKIRVTLDVPDAVRRALRRRDGKTGLATRTELLIEHNDVWFEHTVTICGKGAASVEDEIEEGNDYDE